MITPPKDAPSAPVALFKVGQVVATIGVCRALMPDQQCEMVRRHVRGDWGDVCQEDQASNARAITEGRRIVSAYAIDPAKPSKGYADDTIWVITSADRSVTTLLLPEEN